MNIYDYLKRDHQTVAKLMKKVVNEKFQNERVKLFLKIKNELELHTDPEKSTFYKAIQFHGQHEKEAIEEGVSEHEMIKSILKKIDKAKRKDQWLIHFGELKSMVAHHVQEEEGKIFADAKKILSPSQAEELAVEMDRLKTTKKNTKSYTKQFKKLIWINKLENGNKINGKNKTKNTVKKASKPNL